MNVLNTGLIFTPEVLTQCKNVYGPREPGAEDVNYDIYHEILLQNMYTA